MALRLLRLLLFPLALMYDAVTRLRNHMYNTGYKPSVQFDVFTICVGNLNVGGAGKTPLVEYLIRLLEGLPLATLSRGYGRNTRGFRMAGDDDEAATLGDEPFQLYRKFGQQVAVAVGEERVLAIPHLLHEKPEVQVVVLDDAFQHRRIRPHFSILVTEFQHPFYQDFVLPAGNLREARKGAGRAQAVVVTKCHPTISVAQRHQIEKQVQHYAGPVPVFFGTIAYGQPVGFGKKSALTRSVVAVTGIAHGASFIQHLSEQLEVVKHFQFADHYRYGMKDLQAIRAWCQRHGCVAITTEKDMVRLIAPELSGMVSEIPFFYVPIEMRFIENGSEFDKLVRDQVEKGV